MPVWFLIVFVLDTSSMSAVTDIRVSDDSKFNNEISCNEAGKSISTELQAKLPATVKVMYNCQSLEYIDIKKALPPAI